MNAVIFVRGKNIKEQVAYCRAYAERKGYNVEYVVTGQARELPEIINGFGKKIDRVIMRDITRISRNALENYTVQADIEIYCGALVEVAKDEPREEAFDRLMKNVVMAVRENEAEEIEKRIRRACMEID